MESKPWLNRVRERLARQLLPPNYVQRFMDELADHLDDLKEENMEAVSRLGDPEQVADNAVAAYRRRSFLGRHPVAAFLVFAISPVVAWCVVFFLLGAVKPLNFNFDEHPWILSLIFFAWSAFVGTLYGELAMRVGTSKKWTVASCLMLGATAMLFEYGYGLYTVMLLVQFAVPVTTGCWYVRRKHNHGYPATTLFVAVILPLASYTFLSLAVLLILGIVAQFVVFGSLKFMTVLFQPVVYLVLIGILPTVLASLCCCWLARRFGIGRKWIATLFIVLAMYAAKDNCQGLLHGTNNPNGHWLLIMTCITLTQFLIPLAIGWWFMRRKHDEGQLQLAS